MEIVQRYRCDFCGGTFANKGMCEECESSHRKAVKINGREYSTNARYPSKVYIEMEDGNVITYEKVVYE